MSSDRGLGLGATTTEPHLDSTGDQVTKSSAVGDKTVLDTIKDVLQPNDAKKLGLGQGRPNQHPEPPHSSFTDTLTPGTNAQGESNLGQATSSVTSAVGEKLSGAFGSGNTSSAADTLAPGTNKHGESDLGRTTTSVASAMGSKASSAFDGSNTSSASDMLAPGTDKHGESNLGRTTKSVAGAIGEKVSEFFGKSSGTGGARDILAPGTDKEGQSSLGKQATAVGEAVKPENVGTR